MTEDEMVGWHHRLKHEFEEAPGDAEGQGSLACCSPCGHKELDTTKRLKTTKIFEKNKGFSDQCYCWEQLNKAQEARFSF